MAVMTYLMEHRTHPTADEIYTALHPSIPTLSKTTVYNTLKLLTEKGAALQLTIDERNCCFDADTSPHAHFLCTRCGHVYDMKLNQAELIKCACVPDKFQTEDAQLYLRGCCPRCAALNMDN
ncbi:transcriptional regulator Fur family [Prevotella sp. CAG:5226]|nr:transcriptional regulator Fur family [Prevotella sp. CAG:5226]